MLCRYALWDLPHKISEDIDILGESPFIWVSGSMVQTRDEVAFFYTSDVFSYFDDVSCELAAADCVGFGQVFDVCMGKEKKGSLLSVY